VELAGEPMGDPAGETSVAAPDPSVSKPPLSASSGGSIARQDLAPVAAAAAGDTKKMSSRVSIHDELSAGATDAVEDVRGRRSKLLEVLFHKKSTADGLVIDGKNSDECHDDGNCDDGGGGGLEEVTHEFVK